MKKKINVLIMVFVLLAVLIACNENEKDEEIDSSLEYIGTWTTIYEDEYMDDVFSIILLEEGRFASNNYKLLGVKNLQYGEWFLGEWSVDEEEITFSFDDILAYKGEYYIDDVSIDKRAIEQDDISFKIEDFNNSSFTLSDQLLTKYDEKIQDDVKIVFEYTGQWERTNIHSNLWASFEVIEETDDYFYFVALFGHGGYTGDLSGLAKKNDDGSSTYIHHTQNEEIVFIHFNVENEMLSLTTNDSASLGLGMNVIIDGEYTSGLPTYTNDNIVEDTFGSEERIDFTKDFLGEEAWYLLESTMKSSVVRENDALTFSGLVGSEVLLSGILNESIEVNLLLTEDLKIYYLYRDRLTHIYYTNDENYFDRLPEFLVDTNQFQGDFKFILKTDKDEIESSDYVWIKSHEESPVSLELEDTFYYNPEEEKHWIEIYSKGKIENVSLISSDESTIINSSPILENAYMVYAINISEGEDLKSIRFEDQNGNNYYYPINSESSDKIYHLSKTPESHLKIKYWDESYLKVPYLKKTVSNLEEIVPLGWHLMDSVELDFNEDGLIDHVGVLEIESYNSDRYMQGDYPRILFALEGNSEGYQLNFEDINIVYTSSEGGVMGDPYYPMITDGNSITLQAYGGSNWRWSDRKELVFMDDTWYLAEEESYYTYGSMSISHVKNDYINKIGERDYNDSVNISDEEEIGEDDDVYEVSFEIELDGPPTLEEISNRWSWTAERLGIIEVDRINYSDSIDQDKIIDNIVRGIAIVNSNIVEMNKDYLVYNYAHEYIQKEYVLLYDRSNKTMDVIQESDYLEVYENNFDDLLLVDNKLIFTRLVPVGRVEGEEHPGDAKSVDLYSMNLDGSDLKMLLSFDSYEIEGRYSFIDISYEAHLGKLIINRSRSDSEVYYSFDIDKNKLIILGEIQLN